MIGIRSVPEERVGDDVWLDTTGDRITRVERQLRLKQRRARHAGETSMRIVRRDDDVGGMNPVTVRFDAPRVIPELLRFGVLEDPTAIFTDRGHHTRQVLAWMKPGLISNVQAGSADQRHVPDHVHIETQFRREPRVLVERLRLATVSASTRCV